MQNLNGYPNDIALKLMSSQLLTVNLPNGSWCEFLPEDEQFQRTLAEGGNLYDNNPSAAVDQWAKNCLNKVREFKGWNVGIRGMLGRDCVTLLTKFFEQVCKKDGNLYPDGYVPCVP